MSMLKPCPKCGSKRYIVWENDYWFSCRDCGWSTGVHQTMDEAIKAWNDSEPSCDSCSSWQNDGDTEKNTAGTNKIPLKW